MEEKVDKNLDVSISVFVFMWHHDSVWRPTTLKLHKERIYGRKTLKLPTEIIYFKTTASLSSDLCRDRGKEGRNGGSILHWPEMPCRVQQSVLQDNSPSTSQVFQFHIVSNSVWAVI